MNRFNFLVNIDKYLHFLSHNAMLLMAGDYDLRIFFNEYCLLVPGNWDIITLYKFDDNGNLLNVNKADVKDNIECNKIISIIKEVYEAGIRYDKMEFEFD